MVGLPRNKAAEEMRTWCECSLVSPSPCLCKATQHHCCTVLTGSALCSGSEATSDLSVDLELEFPFFVFAKIVIISLLLR